MSDFGQEMLDRTQPLRDKNRGPLASLAKFIQGLGGGEKDFDRMYSWGNSLSGGLDPSQPYDWGNPDLEDELSGLVRGGDLGGATLGGTPSGEWSEQDMATFIDMLLQDLDKNYGYASQRVR